MWLAHKLVHITTPIGHEEPDPVQPSIPRGPRSFVINGLGYLPKKRTQTVTGDQIGHFLKPLDVLGNTPNLKGS